MARDLKSSPIPSKSEYIIQHVAGCGPFQIILFVSVFVVGHLSNAFIQAFMVFGSYNPGWRCLDSNLTTTTTTDTTTISTISTSPANHHHRNDVSNAVTSFAFLGFPNTTITSHNNLNNNIIGNSSSYNNNNNNNTSSNPLTPLYYYYSYYYGVYQTSTTKSLENTTALMSSSPTEYYITDNDHCSLFESCSRIEFLPGTSTIVTEWGLLCDKAWIPAFMISLQYAGLLVGVTCAGHIGDAIGRKTTMYGAPAISCVVGIISIFSTSWQMFAALRFCIGLSISGFLTFYYVYVVEFVTKRWRSPLPNIPYWPMVCMMFALTCMLLKDWRHVQITGSVIALISILPAIWLPESPRWLEVKNKTKKFENAMTKISRANGKILPSFDEIKVDVEVDDIDNDIEKNKKKEEEEEGEEEKVDVENEGNIMSSEYDGKHSETINVEVRYSILHLFKPAYRKYTLLIVIPWFSMSMIFHALGFGVKALSGDFYINLIIMYAVEIPFSPISMILPNIIGRKRTGIALSGISGACLVTAAFLYDMTSGWSKTTGVFVLAISARVTISAFWGVVMTYTVELYPTVVRGLGTSWGNFMNRVGGVVAPFLIPNDPGSFFVCYLVMAGVAILCTVVVTCLPETKGKELGETFDQK